MRSKFGLLTSVAGLIAGALLTASIALAGPLTFSDSASGRSAAGGDQAIIARDIVPSGQYGAVPAPAGADRQAQMYNALTPLFDHVTAAALNADFKPEPVGNTVPRKQLTADPVPVTRAGVRILRDGYHVPHIYGSTRDDVTWGAGWILAEDRSLLIQQARYDSLVAAIDAPGLTALNLVANLDSFAPSAQTEAEVAKQTNALLAYGAKGRAVLHDVDVFLQGINAYFKATHQNVTPFTRTDIFAFNALKDNFVGEGGGQQALNAQFLAAAEAKLGRRRGLAVWNDLREANDPEAPVSVPGHVAFQPPPTSTSGNVILDPGSLSASASRALKAEQDGRGLASNILMVSGRRSSTHHPIMVAGPQIGYYYPGLTLEEDLEGPGIHQVGVSSAPFPGYIFIGRSETAAWSLTSASLNQIDTYVETLCDNSTHRYLYKGHCLAMQYFDAGKLTAGGTSNEVTFYRTVHGPVIGYAKVHGRLVALTQKRASYGKDALDLLFYRDLAHDQVHDVHQFFRAADQTPQTFNSFYVDGRNIGVFTSGLVPIRPANADPDLPLNGTGREEWRGFTSFANHPQGINPPNGQIVNWNNRTEAGYEAPSNNWDLGAVQRVSLLLRNLGDGGGLTPARVTSAMNAAATQDVREMTLEPVLARVLRTGRAPSARDAKMLELLDRWYAEGGSRLDRTGGGQITAPGAAIMDAAWPHLANAWASWVLGPSLTAQLASFDSVFDAPPGGQYHGWHIYMNKDLRTILGDQVSGKYAVRYCGGGSLALCRKLLWLAVDQAGTQLAAAQGADPSRWRASATAEQISFVPGLLPYKMRYANRPSGIQQVISFR